MQYSVTGFTETPSVIARTIYLDTSVREFLETGFESPAEHFKAYRQITHRSVLRGISRIDNSVVTIYADNEGLVNGSGFMKVSDAREEWFRRYAESPLDPLLIVYDSPEGGRMISFIRDPGGLSKEKGTDMFVKIDLNYSTLVADIINLIERSMPWRAYGCTAF